jgi:hypothetical protein
LKAILLPAVYFRRFVEIQIEMLIWRQPLFANAGWPEPDAWLTSELVTREFAKLQVAGMRLFDA